MPGKAGAKKSARKKCVPSSRNDCQPVKERRKAEKKCGKADVPTQCRGGLKSTCNKPKNMAEELQMTGRVPVGRVALKSGPKGKQVELKATQNDRTNDRSKRCPQMKQTERRFEKKAVVKASIEESEGESSSLEESGKPSVHDHDEDSESSLIDTSEDEMIHKEQGRNELVDSESSSDSFSEQDEHRKEMHSSVGINFDTSCDASETKQKRQDGTKKSEERTKVNPLLRVFRFLTPFQQKATFSPHNNTNCEESFTEAKEKSSRKVLDNKIMPRRFAARVAATQVLTATKKREDAEELQEETLLESEEDWSHGRYTTAVNMAARAHDAQSARGFEPVQKTKSDGVGMFSHKVRTAQHVIAMNKTGEEVSAEDVSVGTSKRRKFAHRAETAGLIVGGQTSEQSRRMQGWLAHKTSVMGFLTKKVSGKSRAHMDVDKLSRTLQVIDHKCFKISRRQNQSAKREECDERPIETERVEKSFWKPLKFTSRLFQKTKPPKTEERMNLSTKKNKRVNEPVLDLTPAVRGRKMDGRLKPAGCESAMQIPATMQKGRASAPWTKMRVGQMEKVDISTERAHRKNMEVMVHCLTSRQQHRMNREQHDGSLDKEQMGTESRFAVVLPRIHQAIHTPDELQPWRKAKVPCHWSHMPEYRRAELNVLQDDLLPITTVTNLTKWAMYRDPKTSWALSAGGFRKQEESWEKEDDLYEKYINTKLYPVTDSMALWNCKSLDDVGVDDMTQLTDLHEGAVLMNLKTRYERGIIYTYIGTILISVNPYQMFDLYGTESVLQYRGKDIVCNPPHLFALANAACTKLKDFKENQCILISGESGSGKTEATKLMLRYMAAIGGIQNHHITQPILEASPLLESFGNAKTMHNDNSSRFGKYVELYLENGVINGASTSQYLLEKSRIVFQTKNERNYHIFYELLAGLSPQQKQRLFLQDAETYFYLNQGGNCEIPGKKDREDFRRLLSAMEVLSFSSEEQMSIFKVLSSILQLGNVCFSSYEVHATVMSDGQSVASVVSSREIDTVADLLQVSPEGIEKAITFKVMETMREKIFSPLSVEVAIDARDAISKVLYSVLFNWLIDRINCQVAPHPEATSVAILDIYGFEDLTMNSFEQLCINYANEYLQFFFNRIIFKQEQEIYEKEKINWQNIAFNDNQPCLLLLSQRPYGILRILDDQSTFPQATDQTFLQKCHYHHVSNPLYCKPKMPLPEFSIKHYAGKVTYQVHKFLDKNHDQVRQEVLELFMQSGIKIVADEFREHTKEVQRTSLGKLQGPGRRYQPPTVAAKFSHSLFELMEKMAKCNSFFVRCLKPNRTKEPNLFELEMMSSQLRYSGIFETIRIRKDGYPIRLFFSTFLSRYKLLTGIQNLKQTDHNNCIVILRALCEHSPGELYQIGITRVFLKERLYLVLERRRERLITQAATTLQKHIRAYQAQRRYADLRKKVILLQAQVRGFQCRRRYQCLRRGLIRFRATVLMYLNRKKYLKMKEEMQKKPTDDIRRHDVLKDTAVDVSQMDIPVALAAMMDGSRDVGHIHDGKAIRIEAPEWLDSAPPLPMDINNFPFSKFVSMHFKKQTLGVALSNPPSTLTHIPEDLHSDAMEMLKMVIQFTSGPELHGLSEFLFGNHVVHKGLMEGRLRDELLCQLANEAERAHGANEARRGWLLLSLCLCVFTPSVKLQKYFLKYVSDHGSGGFAAICQRNLTHGLAVAEVLPGESRSLPPCLLEWHAASEHVAMALNITSFGGETILSPVDSWSRGEDVVGSILKHKGMADSCRGWSLALQENGHALEIAGHDYVLDLISFLEHPPAFQCQPPTYLGSHSPDGTNFMNNSHGNAETRTSMPPVSPITPNSVGPTGLLCQTHNTANLEAASQHHFDGYIDKMLGPLPPSENGDMAKASTMARRMKGGGDLGSNPEPPPTTVPSNMAPIAPQGPYLMPLVPGLVPSAIPTYQGIPASQQHNSAQQNMMAQQQALINQQAYLLAQQMVYQQMMCQQPPPPPPLYPPPPAPSAGAEAKRGNLHADDFTGDSMPEPTQNIRNIIKEYHGRNPQRSFSPEEPKIAQSRACPRPSDPHDQAIAILQGQRETPDIWSNPASTRKPHTEGKPVSLVTSSAIERSHETIARVKPVGISSHPDFTKMPPTPTSFAPATCRRKQSSVRFVEDVERGTPSVETAKPEKLLTPLHGKRPGAAYCYRGVPWKLVIRKEVFYPKQSFNHPAVLNLLFMQIVHDTFDERCQRVSPEERDKMKGLLETVGPNPQACDDERLKKRIVMAARDNWSCYFCRLFPATGSVGSEVDWLGVSHKGIKLLATTKTGEHSYLRVLQSYSYTDLQLVGLPERAAIQLVFHQDKLSLFSPRAAHAKHLIDHFLSELKKDSQYVVAIRSYSTSDSSLLRFHKGDLIKLLPMDGLEPGFYFGCLMKRTVIHLEDKQGTTEFGWHFGMRRGHSGLFPAEYVQTTAGPEPETPSESPLPCPHIDPDRKTESSSVSSDYAESLDDFEFVPEDKTKYSMVEYARLYFRQPLPPAPSRWRKKEPIVPPDPADLVKYNKSPIQRSLIESNEPKIDKMAADLFLAIMRFMGDYPLKGQKETDCIYSILKVCKECETMRDEVYCQLMKQVTANRSMKVDSCHRGWRLLYLVTAYTRCSETMQPYLLHTLHDVHNDPKASFQGMSRACIQHLRRTLQIGGRTQMPTITELRALVSGRNTKRQLILLPGSMERHVRVKTSTVVEDIIEELCIEMGLHHAEAWREYTLFLVMKRGDSVRPLSPKEYMLDISAEAEKVDENHRLWLRRVVWLQPLRLDNETYVRIHYHQVLSEFLKGFMMKLVEHISDEQAQSIAKLAALQHRTQCMAYPPTLREIQELIPPTFARLKRMEDWLPLVLQQHRLLNTLNPHQARSQFMGLVSALPLFGSSSFLVESCSDGAISTPCLLAVNASGLNFVNLQNHEIQLTYQMDEVQSTRTNRADSETSEPYVEIQLGDLLNQHITQLQLKQGLELCCVVAMHQEVILEVREQQIDLPSSDITLL